MALRKYTIAEFRKNVREAINNIEAGGQTFITRHGVRYELIKAPVQGGKQQLKQINKAAIDNLATSPAYNFPKNGDAGAQVETADDLSDAFTDAFGPLPPEKNIASADALNKAMEAPVEFAPDTPINELDTPSLRGQLTIARAELNRIDIDTQDPDEVERGSELAARISDIEAELKNRGI